MFDLKDLLTLIKGRKALPVGTERIWQGQRYVKHTDGWIAVKGEHHGKKSDKKTENPEKVHNIAATQALRDNPGGYGIEDLHPEQANVEGGFASKKQKKAKVKKEKKDTPKKERMRKDNVGVMQDAKKVEDAVTAFFVEGKETDHPDAQAIIENISNNVKGDITNAFRPKGGKEIYVKDGDKGVYQKGRGGEPKADLVIETTEKKYRISIKAGDAFVATFGSPEAFMGMMKGITKDPDILRRAQLAANGTGYTTNFSRSKAKQEWFIGEVTDRLWSKYLKIDKALPNEDMPKLKKEVAEELQRRFDADTGEYDKQRDKRGAVMKEFFGWLKDNHNDEYMGIYQEGYRGGNQFGPKSDATADYLVNTGSGAMDELTDDFIKSHYFQRDQMFGVPRRGVSARGLKDAEDKVSYIVENVTRVQFSIKI